MATASQDSLVNVILEEIGHFVDAQVNSVDSAGDEGAIFAALVQGDSLSISTLQALRDEDDHATITVNGQIIQVEQQNFTGTDGNDTITGTIADDFIEGKGGNDILNGGDGNDTLYGDDQYSEVTGSIDTLIGGNGNDRLYGGAGDDSLDGGLGDNWLYGGTGTDTFAISAGNDLIVGGAGNETINGGDGNDTLYGDDQYSEVTGSIDTLIGGNGNDRLYGGAGDDSLDGIDANGSNLGRGEIDYLSGGTGSDKFILGDSTWIGYDDGNNTTTGDADYAEIADFNTTENDIIQLKGGVNYLLTVVGADTQLFIDKPNTEPDELIGIIKNRTGLSLTGSYFVYNQTLPSITLAVAPASVLEDGIPNLVYTFTRTGVTTSALTVNYSIAGTADATDYTGATPGTGKTITFLAGSATATLTLDPTADTAIEANETVALTLATGTAYTIGTTTAVTGNITNDDASVPSISLSLNYSGISEDSPSNFIYTFTRTGVTTNSLTVN